MFGVYVMWWPVFSLNITGGCVYSEWNLTVLISGWFHHASLLSYLSKNCNDNMYYVMILKVLIKSNYTPPYFGVRNNHHQRSSHYKLKHYIIKNCLIMHTHSDFIRTLKILIKCILLEKFLDTDQIIIYFLVYTWGHIVGVLIRWKVNLPQCFIKQYKMKSCGEASFTQH